MLNKSFKQIVPPGFCLKCDVCCRYAEQATIYTPCFLPAELKDNPRLFQDIDKIGDKIDAKPLPISRNKSYACRFFVPEKNGCGIYEERPFDCRIYPFMVTYSKDGKSVVLVADTKCPYIKEAAGSSEIREYADYISGILEDEEAADEISLSKIFINEFQEDSVVMKKLGRISKTSCLEGLGLKKISPEDSAVFDAYFSKAGRELSAYSFVPAYSWSWAVNVLWKIIDGSLCVFCGAGKSYFLFCPPVSAKFSKKALAESVEMLSLINGRLSGAARIENVCEETSSILEGLGYKIRKAGCEYVYGQKDLVELRGANFKSRRSDINYFTKNNIYEFRPLDKNDIGGCLDLYKEWAKERLIKNPGSYYRLMMEDSFLMHKIILSNLDRLNVRGYTVLIGKDIEAYTLGYPLSRDVFAVLLEVANLKRKGLAQFIFQAFSGELSGYKFINTMGDSGLKNLAQTKESYRPVKKSPLYTAYC